MFNHYIFFALNHRNKVKKMDGIIKVIDYLNIVIETNVFSFFPFCVAVLCLNLPKFELVDVHCTSIFKSSCVKPDIRDH